MNTTHWNNRDHQVIMVLETPVTPRLTYALSEQFRDSFIGVSAAQLRAGILPTEIEWLEQQARQVAQSMGRRADEQTYITMQSDIELGGMRDIPCTFIVGWQNGNTFIALLHDHECEQYKNERKPQ